MSECATCATYPPSVQSRIDRAGREHHEAMADIRANGLTAPETAPTVRYDGARWEPTS